jgi:hypothetical protein
MRKITNKLKNKVYPQNDKNSEITMKPEQMRTNIEASRASKTQIVETIINTTKNN